MTIIFKLTYHCSQCVNKLQPKFDYKTQENGKERVWEKRAQITDF